MVSTALVVGSIDEVVRQLGLAAPTAAPRDALRPLSKGDANADRLAVLTAVGDGAPMGEITLEGQPHPDCWSGDTARLIVRMLPGHDAQSLRAVVVAARAYALASAGLSCLLAEPATAADASVLSEAGFEALAASPLYRSELVSSFWRSRDVLIIAEAGSNWRMGARHRDVAMAKALIDAAADAGADVVKFQSFRPEQLYVSNAGASDYLADAGIDETMDELFADIQMPADMLPELAEHARKAGIGFMSTAFSAQDFAEVDPFVEIHKIASYEVSHRRLIELAARSGKPTVMSTGAATLDDVRWAVEHFHHCGGRDLCLMQCTAKYPAPLEALNLATIPNMARRFGVASGLSDHSREAVIGPLAAAALGARAIEKHFTLDNRLPGPDHAFAVTPGELAEMVTAVRAGAQARGTGLKTVHSAEQELASFAQRGLQALAKINAGDTFVEDQNVAILRPGNQTKGVHPRYLDDIVGRQATREIMPGEGLKVGDWT